MVKPCTPAPEPLDREQTTERGCLIFLLVFTLLITAAHGLACWHRGERAYALIAAATAGVAVGCAVWAWHGGGVRWPMRVISATLVGVLSWLTLQQGPALPAAAWWLSVMPFILAVAGLYRMAIATVAGFITLVTVLFHGPTAETLWGAPFVPAPPWRQFVAVVGSELLGLGMILVWMRSRAAAAQALEAAHRTAVDALAAKTRFLANMSHEIRTPLNGLIGTGELLRSRRHDDAQREQLLALQERSAKALLALVNDVLDWSKLEAGKVVLEARPLDLRRLVAEGNELFAVQAYDKGIELTSSCSPEVPRGFVGDATRLRQVLDNLVSNAVKFTAHGGVHIHLSMEAGAATVPPPRRQVRIEVSDSGIGIEADKLATLFEAYTQADDSVTRRYGGTGLGLAISIELARLMGGRIDVSSSPGRGSNFALVVPLEVVEPTRHAARKRAPRRDVLLASASTGVQRHLKTLLHDLGSDLRVVCELPGDAAAVDCRLLLIDAPLLATLPQPRPWLESQTAHGRRVAVVTPLGADLGIELPDDVSRLYKPVRRRALIAVLDALDAAPSEWSVRREFLLSAPAAGPHVLIAEDNPVNQLVVQAMLTELGATCVIAADGREALDCLAAEHVDLVLMDMQMPELDGVAATRAWRAVEAAAGRGRVPIVAMTAQAPGEEAQACRSAGMDGFLAKPFGMADLGRVLSTWRHRTLPTTAPSPLHVSRGNAR